MVISISLKVVNGGCFNYKDFCKYQIVSVKMLKILISICKCCHK